VFIFIIGTLSWELLLFFPPLPAAPWTLCVIRRRPVELSNNFNTTTHLIVMCRYLGQPRESAGSRSATDGCINIKLRAYVALFSRHSSLHERAQMAAVCLVACHLVNTYVTQVAVLVEKTGEGNKGLKSLEERKKAFKDEYKKRVLPPRISWALPPVQFVLGVLVSCGRIIFPVLSFSPPCQLCYLPAVPTSVLCDITASLNKPQSNVFWF
jgi:hypothetical protein